MKVPAFTLIMCVLITIVTADCDGRKTGWYANIVKDCHEFYFCRHNRQVGDIGHCIPPHFQFDERVDRCLPGDLVKCANH